MTSPLYYSHILMECRIALNLFARSTTDPNHEDRTTAASDRTKAYTEAYRNVPGKIVARNKTAPNSNIREFHVERKWEIYNRNSIRAGF